MALGWFKLRNGIMAVLAIEAIWLFGLLSGLNMGITSDIAGTGWPISMLFGILDAAILIAFYTQYI